jgi:hypothetical protein
MIVPPSHPGGVVPTPALSMEPTAVGALAGVRAVSGNSERQDQERAGSGAGVIFEATAQPPPLPLYGPDGRPVQDAPPLEGSEDTAPLQGAAPTEESEESAETERASGPVTEQDLSAEDRAVLEELKARDAEVRAHEAAHVAAGGQHVRGGASYGFETGPDGRQYAVEGEVGIDTAPVPNDPEATAAKARQVRAAALAPAQPSGADQSIAAQAAQMEAQAMVEIAEAQRDEASGAREGSPWDQYVQDPAEQSAVGGQLSLVA